MAGEVKEIPYGQFAADFGVDRLANLCDAEAGIQTGPFGSQLHQRDYVPVGTPIITVEHLGENRILHDGVPRVSDADRDRLSRYLLREGDIVFSRVGSVDRRALVRSTEDGWMFSGRCLRVRPDSRKIDSGYLSYFFGLPTFKEHIRAIAVGATMPSLNTTLLSDVLVPHPLGIAEQRAIAHILGTLDDKIDLNRRMNETLEEMARAIFRSWFVDFDPVRAKMDGRWRPGESLPGLPAELFELFPDRLVESELGEVPEGWRVRPLDDVVSLSRDSVKPQDHIDEVFAHYSIPAFDEGRMPQLEPGVSIKSNKYAVGPNSVLVSKLNPRIKRVWLPPMSDGPRAICSTEFLVTEPHSSHLRPWLYCLLESDAFQSRLGTLVTGTSGSHQRVRPQAFLAMQFVLPPEQLRTGFVRRIEGFLSRTNMARAESRTLGNLRDTLLPKLISGELRVPGAERIAERAD